MLRYDRYNTSRTGRDRDYRDSRDNNMSDAHLIEEIARIKDETNRLKDILLKLRT